MDNTFIKVSTKSPSAYVSDQEMQRRASLSLSSLKLIAGSDSDSDLVLLLSYVFRKVGIPIVKAGLMAIGYNLFRVLTVSEAVQLQSLLRMPTNSFRRLRRIFGKFGFKIFPSEPKMRKEQARLTSHISKESVITEEISLQKKDKDTSQSAVTVLKVADLITYVTNCVQDLQNRNQLSSDTNFNDEIWLKFGGDKGGDLMKFHFEVVNDISYGSVFNVHMFSLYEGSDCSTNLYKVLQSYREAFRKLQPD